MTKPDNHGKRFNSLDEDDFLFFLSMNGYFRKLGNTYLVTEGNFTDFENRIRKLVSQLEAWKHAGDVDEVAPAFYTNANFRWFFLKEGKPQEYRITCAALIREPDRAFAQREIVYIDTEDGIDNEDLIDLWKSTRWTAGAWDEGVLVPRDIRAWQSMVNETLEDFIIANP